MSQWDAAFAEESIRAFFGERGVASLRLPSGWFGRPYDNWHELSALRSDESALHITLDDRQMLTADCAGPVARHGRVLAIPVHGGEWAWTDYGGTQRHSDQFGAGRIEFHAP